MVGGRVGRSGQDYWRRIGRGTRHRDTTIVDVDKDLPKGRPV